ncbi:MAG: hypothetical protein ABEI86_05735, partial [Halobacteriaceae archaeon]
MTSYTQRFRWLLVLAGIILLGWFLRPWFHGFVMVVYTTPAVIEVIIAWVIGIGIFRRVTSSEERQLLKRLLFDQRDDSTRQRQLFAFLFSRPTATFVLLAALLLGTAPLILAGPYSQVHIANNLAVESTSELPEINATQPRVLPKSVAQEYASNSLQFPRYQLAAGDIALRNGRPTWTFGLAPDGTINNFLLTGKGAVFVDMTTQQKRVNVVQDDPRVSFGLGLFQGKGVISTYRWHLIKNKFFATYKDPITIEHNNRIYMAVPYRTYGFHWRWTPPPMPYTTPEWGGVALIHPDGKTVHLDPEAARNNPVLEEQRLFPFDLARHYVQAQRYQRGILNKWFIHEDELELAPIPGEKNRQPFLAVTKQQGLQYFVAAEPYGNAQGIYQIWLFDGRTGNIRKFQLPVESALTGPRQAADFVRKSNSQTDWDRFEPSEPVPAVLNGTLFWQVRVVPSDSSGIAYTAFVN